MSQQDVFDYLKGRDWTDSDTIVAALGLSEGSVAQNLRRLVKRGDVEMKSWQFNLNKKLWRVK